MKQIIKLSFNQKQNDRVLKYFEKLLTYLPNVSYNYGEDSLNRILEYIGNSKDTKLLTKVFDLAVTALESSKNERLLLKSKLRRASLLVENNDFEKAEISLIELHKICEDDILNPSKGTYLLEVFATEIDLYTRTNNFKKLKNLYDKSLTVDSAIPHPKIMAIIRECGGKIYMREKNYNKAFEEFFESFKNYDEAGSLERINILKYIVLSSILSETEINPFESQEIRPYKKNPKIIPMTSLVDSFQRKNIDDFNNVLKKYHDEIFADDFIKSFIDEITIVIRSQAFIKILKPYKRVSLTFLADSLGDDVTIDDVQHLLIMLTVEGRLSNWRIDLIDGYLEYNDEYSVGILSSKSDFNNQENSVETLKRIEASWSRKFQTSTSNDTLNDFAPTSPEVSEFTVNSNASPSSQHQIQRPPLYPLNEQSESEATSSTVSPNALPADNENSVDEDGDEIMDIHSHTQYDSASNSPRPSLKTPLSSTSTNKINKSIFDKVSSSSTTTQQQDKKLKIGGDTSVFISTYKSLISSISVQKIDKLSQKEQVEIEQKLKQNSIVLVNSQSSSQLQQQQKQLEQQQRQEQKSTTNNNNTDNDSDIHNDEIIDPLNRTELLINWTNKINKLTDQVCELGTDPLLKRISQMKLKNSPVRV